MNFEVLANMATAIGIPVAVAALVLNFLQNRKVRKIAEGQFLLELERMSALHDEVHINFRPGGKWSHSESTEISTLEWVKIEDYMGFFEHCELLMRSGSLSPSDFDSIFGYRLFNLVQSEQIKKYKIDPERDHWNLFVAICNRFKITI